MGLVPDRYLPSHPFTTALKRERQSLNYAVLPFKETERFPHGQDEKVLWQHQLENENPGIKTITYVLGLLKTTATSSQSKRYGPKTEED